MKAARVFPTARPRRLRRTPFLRRLVAQTKLNPEMLVAPLFVNGASAKREEVASMPGQFRLPVREAVGEVEELQRLGVGGVLLFGVPPRKDAMGTGAYSPDGVIQQAVRAIKKAVDRMAVITDVCLCEYTSHGHCGVLKDGEVDNDATLPLLAEIAVSHARAGADMVAPSAMMDGQVRVIRQALDQAGFGQVPIMSYSAKYASALYGPFREAVESAPRAGDRRGYQMDPPNIEEALRETALDIEEGADIVMVKPASSYLDVVRAVKEHFHHTTAAYQVSGEYALVKAASEKGWIDEPRLVMELITSIRRAGADLIITYYAKDVARWIQKERG
ncbi:MAG: porphobilinogen synthase [Candidatus Omnitrophica bacterium]|nr:porphobilinogen synthase [Candidatus Omnitrophota bacterium]